jgi:DNA-3-methyladenine glycosylase
MQKLDYEFYNRPSTEVAVDLLGKHLVHCHNNIKYIGRIVEVEAYMGPDDKAAHSYNKRTPRNEIMFGAPGFAYIYMIYGMYYCVNAITSPKGIPHGVLIRAVEPISGFNEMAMNRYQKDYNLLTNMQIINLTNGPGKLCQAMQITKDNYGDDLTKDRLFIVQPETSDIFNIVKSPRINIDYSDEAKDYLWRFYIENNKYVSKSKTS